jgi:hypothetical protein
MGMSLWPLARCRSALSIAASTSTSEMTSAGVFIVGSWALGDPWQREQIEAAHARAVESTVRYLREQVPVVRRRYDGQVVEEHAEDVIAAEYRHTTARGVSGARAPDPQLHSHVVISGAVREDERIVAVASRPIFRSARELGAFYRSALAEELAGDQAAENAVQAWGQLTSEHDDIRSVALIADASNQEIDRLNARAQHLRAERGELGHQEITLPNVHYGLRDAPRVDRGCPCLAGSPRRRAWVRIRLGTGPVLSNHAKALSAKG